MSNKIWNPHTEMTWTRKCHLYRRTSVKVCVIFILLICSRYLRLQLPTNFHVLLCRVINMFLDVSYLRKQTGSSPQIHIMVCLNDVMAKFKVLECHNLKIIFASISISYWNKIHKYWNKTRNKRMKNFKHLKRERKFQVKNNIFH